MLKFKNLNIHNRYSAFTIAEVLITLGIIGIIASMTLPVVIGKYQEKHITSQLQKEYSTISQAYNLATFDLGTPDNWGLLHFTQAKNEKNNFLYYLKPYLKISQYCGLEKDKCWKDTKALNGTNHFDHDTLKYYSKAILNDGTSILTYVLSPDCTYKSGSISNICGQYRVDVNGRKAPNVLGKDVFTFHITKDKIIPAGTNLEDPKSMHSFDAGCLKKGGGRGEGRGEGRGCTAWVLYNNNMDYLHCNDLSWESKQKCK